MDSPPSEVSPVNYNGRRGSQGNHKKRVRVWTEDDRAKHRVFEKSRREAFSDSLLSLARFLPALATVKESKLSKHTIVDESLKYHESQQAKVDELQKSIEVLKSENETLLAELGQWRRCLDTPPQQAPTTLPYGPPNALETVDEVSTTTHEPLNFAANYTSVEPCSSMTYRDHLEPDCGTPLELPAAPMNSAIPIQSFSGAVAGIQQIDSYTLQQTALPFAEIPVGDFSLLHSQPSTQSGSFREQPVDAAMWTQQDNQAARQGLMSYQFYHQNLPPDSRRYQF